MADETVNLLGVPTLTGELASRGTAKDIDENTGFGETLGAAFQGNLAPQAWKTIESKFSHAPDMNFNLEQWLSENGSTVPTYLHDRFSGVRSGGEAAELAARIQNDLRNQEIIASKGATGFAAVALAGMVDVDAPLALISGGTVKAATTAARLGQGALRGGTAGAAFAAAQTTVDPLAETSDIVLGAMMGAGIGGAAGVALNPHMRAVAEDFENSKADLAEMSPDPYLDFEESGSSLGAHYRGDSAVDTSSMSAEQKKILEDAQDTMRMPSGYDGENVANLLEDMGTVDDAAGRAGRKLATAISKTPFLRSLFDDIAAGGTIMKGIAYDLLESPAGRARNNLSASGYEDFYQKRLATHAANIHDIWEDYAKTTQMPFMKRHDGSGMDAFTREVYRELDARAWNEPPEARTQNKHVKDAADRWDEYMKEDRLQKQGREGQTAVDGAETLADTPGHYTREWSGADIRRMEKMGHKVEDMIEMIALAYRKANPALKKDGHDMVVAKAIVRRAKSHEEGVDSNMLKTMNSDGQEYLRQLLRDSGDEDMFEPLLKAIKGEADEAGMLASNKARVDLDMRVSHKGMTMYDLINTNMSEMLDRNTRRTAGAAALARKGITNRGQQKTMIDAAVAEMAARGDTNIQKHRQTLENMFTYFNGGVVGKGVDPTLARMKGLASLGLLNQMGVTQLGETGAQIAAVGMDTWKRHAKQVFQAMRKDGEQSALAKEMAVWNGRLGQEEHLFRPENQMLDEMRNSTGYMMELNSFLKGLDVAIGKGRRLQGYISAFYFVKGTQQKIAVTSMADKVFQRIRDGVDGRLLHDIGIDPEQFKKYLDGVEWEDGYVDRLNMDQWDPRDAEAFSIAINRSVNQTVQKGMIGEDAQWWHSDMGALFGFLRTFPLMAIQKQAARNLSLGSPVVVAMTAMGLATAGTAYTAKQIINGRGVPDGLEMAKGAFAMSNMTGWFPMMYDPVAAALGMNSIRFNQYGRHHAGEGILPEPIMLETLNKQAHAVGALNPFGDMSRNDRIRSLQSLAFVGNAYGMPILWNAMKN